MQVRERIRINGQPISPELFTKYFWRLYHRLDETKVPMLEGWRRGGGGAGGGGDRSGGPVPEGSAPPRTPSLMGPCPQDDSSCVSMPSYFRFLTLMAFHVFLQEKVGAHS